MLPDQFDCIIVGTGLTNAIVAAACSRIGQTVLHIDKNSFYGHHWASFTFEQLLGWFKLNDPSNPCLVTPPSELLEKSRMFCIDLTPRFVFSNGTMVDLLVKSNVSRYHDFKNNIRILSMIDDEIQFMPCSRSDVFNSSLLKDLVAKRRLMKFIETCVKDNIDGDGENPIGDYLIRIGLTPNLQNFIINSIAMVEPSCSIREAAKKVKNFVYATEKYGTSPFLFPLYGCGEYPQSFCRLSAVFGGTYCLNTDIIKIEKKDKKFCVELADTTIISDSLVLEHDYLNKYHRVEETISQKQFIGRAIVITKESVMLNEDSLQSFMRIPADDNNPNPTYLIELNSSVMVCPQGYNIVYLWTKLSDSNEEVEPKLAPHMKTLETNNLGSSNIIWKVFFKQPCNSEQTKIENLFISSPPTCDDIDYDSAISEAKRIFGIMNPDKEFLPRAPDSGEIITGDDE